MFFDETDQRDGSVAASVEKLLSCCNPTEETRGQKKASPPLVVFILEVPEEALCVRVI